MPFLGMDFQKWYNPQISWIDSHVVMPCLTANGTACQSSTNVIAGSAECSSHADMTRCSNGATCKNQVVLVAKQVVKSFKVNVVLAKAFVNMVCGDPASIMWCTLVCLVINYMTGQAGVQAQYVQLCNEFQDVFHDEPGLPLCRQLDHEIDPIDESLLPPKHRQYRLSQVEQAEVKQ